MYKLTGRICNGAKISGFELEDDERNIKQLSYKDTVKLIRSGQVSNFDIIRVDDSDYIVGTGSNKLTDLPFKNRKGRLELKNRKLSEDGHVIGYVVTALDTGEEIQISMKTAWELAYYGQIRGLTARLIPDSLGEEKKVLLTD